LKRYDEALEVYKKALELEPNNDNLKEGLAQVEKKVKAQNMNERGEELISKNKPQEAVQHFSLAIELDPQESAFYGNRFDGYMRLGNYDKALEDAEMCIRLRPDWAKGYQRRAEALTRLERYDDAAATYTAALKLEPNNSKLSSELNTVIQEGVRQRMRANMAQASGAANSNKPPQ
jgi:stress-induced-phosphoprotein 1